MTGGGSPETIVNERDLGLLDAEFRVKIDAAVAQLRASGMDMLLYCAVRSPWTQARLWRQSRTRSTIEAMAAKMEGAGAPFLASVLIEVGPQHGRPVTNAAPGLSWHQWGLACDGVPLRDGRAVWGLQRAEDASLWRHWRDACEAAELTSGGRWSSPDWPHVQQPAHGSPLHTYTWAAIDEAMVKRWSR